MTRSTFISRSTAVAAIGAVSATGLLSACGSDDDDGGAGTSSGPTQTASSGNAGEIGVAQPDTGTPVKGGNLRIGLVSGGDSESFNPAFSIYTVAGYQMESMIFDKLAVIGDDFDWKPSLASSLEASSDGKELMITLRDGVTWHDGAPLTPEDVIFSINTWLDPSNGNAGALSAIDPKAIKKDGAGVRIGLTRPYAGLPAVFASSGCPVIKDGTKTFDDPVGTGAFKLTSFKPGVNSEWARNDAYWDAPTNVDTAELIGFADDTTVVNALMGDQIDIALMIPQNRAKALAKDENLRVYIGADSLPQTITMRVDKAPFDDVRVRQAMKLIADRQAISNAVFAGFAKIGNDMLGLDFPGYATDIPQREQDIEQAKSLLKQAGQEDLRITLETSDVISGMTGIAALYAQQAAQAGVTVRVKKVPPAQYFDPGAGYLSRIFGQDTWPVFSVPSVWDLTLRTTSFTNETHWSAPGWDAKLDAAQAASDEATSNELWKELMQIQYDEGGYIIPVGSVVTSATSAKVKNVPTTGVGWSTSPALNHAWLEA